ncbi:hypothetical protein BGX20_004638 [Mortierella sp. AD010]|nr:hypothetical protein BGX20_004638 [Mortierella sp. AD010]
MIAWALDIAMRETTSSQLRTHSGPDMSILTIHKLWSAILAWRSKTTGSVTSLFALEMATAMAIDDIRKLFLSLRIMLPSNNSYKGMRIMRPSLNAVLQIQSRIIAVRQSSLETLRTIDDHEVGEQANNDYLQDLEEQRSLLHELQQLHNSFSAVSTNPTPSKPESKEKDLTFPKDLSKFSDVCYRNARNTSSQQPILFGSNLGMAIKDDKKRNEHITCLFTLEESGDMTVDDVHKLFLRVCSMTAQTVVTSKELLEMRNRPDETYHEFGSSIKLQIKRTGTHDKTPAIISHLFSDASPLARTDLKLWLLVRDLYKHIGLPFPGVKFITLSDLASAYQFLESPTRSESSDSSQASSSHKNRSRSDSKRKSYSGRNRRDASPSSAGPKGSSDHSAQKDNHKKARI